MHDTKSNPQNPQFYLAKRKKKTVTSWEHNNPNDENLFDGKACLCLLEVINLTAGTTLKIVTPFEQALHMLMPLFTHPLPSLTPNPRPEPPAADWINL